MPLDLTNPFELSIAQAVIGMETNDGRFENFCREVVSVIEGDSIIFSTSKSWDLGRDGVGGGKARGIYMCASLRDDVDAKVLSDLERINSTTSKIERLYFCSSKPLSEHRITLLETQLASESDNKFPTVCLGVTQLVEASARDPKILERYYASEIRDALRAISSEPTDESEVRGLRLALIAAAGDTSNEIRKHLYEGALLEALFDGGRTLNSCARRVSENLHLGYVIADSAIRPHMLNLLAQGIVVPVGPSFELSSAGVKRLDAVRLEAAERLLRGRTEVRKSIEALIGEALGDDQFRKVWEIFEERVAAYFHSKGLALVAEVSELFEIAPQPKTVKAKSQLSFLHELATAVASTSSHSQRRAELYQAVTDLFTDRTSAATDWLVKVCAGFIASCALGLEHSSAAALARLLARTALVLDSDVVLSLLGEGEPEHEAVALIVAKWTSLNGKVLVAESVLEEVAYHAHIAQFDFDDVANLLPGTSEDRLRIVENVFVRSFAEHMAAKRAALGQWPKFVSQYKGRSEYDYAKVATYLRAEHAVGILPPRGAQFERLERDVRAFLIKTSDERGFHGKTASDKATRDARLYAQMISYLEAIRATDPGATCLLMSSAHRLAEAENRFHESGEQQIVVPISVVLHLLSLLPQVSLGLSAMKSFLFEERRAGFSSDLERTILRSLRSSREHSVPWAKRGLLMRELRDRLIDDARKQGRYLPGDANTSSLEREALSEGHQDRTVELIGQSLDKIAVDTHTEAENARLRKENASLLEQLKLARDRAGKR